MLIGLSCGGERINLGKYGKGIGMRESGRNRKAVCRKPFMKFVLFGTWGLDYGLLSFVPKRGLLLSNLFLPQVFLFPEHRPSELLFSRFFLLRNCPHHAFHPVVPHHALPMDR